MALTSTIVTAKSGDGLEPDMQQATISLNAVADEALTALVTNTDVTKQIQVYGMLFSSDVASGFILQSNDNVIVPLNMSSVGGIINGSISKDIPLFVCNMGESLKLKNKSALTGATNAGIIIIYKIRILRS